MKNLLLIILLIPAASLFSQDDLELKRYESAYDYVINSSELDSFYVHYKVEVSERTFCLSKMIYTITPAIFWNEVISYEMGIGTPENDAEKEEYRRIEDSIFTNDPDYTIIEYKDLSFINDKEIDCYFKIFFSEIDKDRVMVGLPFGRSIYHVHDRRNVHEFSYSGIDFLIYFEKGTSKIDTVFSSEYVK